MSKERENTNRNIRICIRLTKAERDKIVAVLKQTPYRKLSELARKKLLDKPVKIFTRNQSLDTLMEELVLLQKELNALGNNFNQVVKRMNTTSNDWELKFLHRISKEQQDILIQKAENIQSVINKFADQWFQNS